MTDEVYWREVAKWMGDVIAANADRQIMLKATPRGEKQRQARIAKMAAAALSGQFAPSNRHLDTIVERLMRVPPADSL